MLETSSQVTFNVPAALRIAPRIYHIYLVLFTVPSSVSCYTDYSLFRQRVIRVCTTVQFSIFSDSLFTTNNLSSTYCNLHKNLDDFHWELFFSREKSSLMNLLKFLYPGDDKT